MNPAQRYEHACLSRTYLIMEAVFSDETEQYVTPYDPDPGDAVTLRVRTARGNVDRVYLHVDTSEKPVLMEKEPVQDGDALFDYYAARHTVSDAPLRYAFAVHKDGRVYFYNKRGLQETLDPHYHFRLIPGFRTPDWAKGAVMYQIFVDRFRNGNPANDPQNLEYRYLGRTTQAKKWDDAVDPDDICSFYGGDLQGIIDKMPYLRGLGVEALYLNPIFVSPSSHKYDIQDYEHVDPHFGSIPKEGGHAERVTHPANLEASNALFARLVETAHAHGMKVILDGVFNHCGSFHKWMDKAGVYQAADSSQPSHPSHPSHPSYPSHPSHPLHPSHPPGAYHSKDSPYRGYFLWLENNWPDNDRYDSWWGNTNHPKLNYEDAPELYEYMLRIAQKWVSPPYNADGWRLDVAADLGRSPAFNHHFWQGFRDAVKSVNPEALILAEHYGDPSPWLSGGEWDSLMNYDAFMEPLTWFLTGMNKHSEDAQPHLYNNALALEEALAYHMAHFNIHALEVAMNQLSNHDHSRFLTRTNREIGRLHTRGPEAACANTDLRVMMEAVIFQMTWPGAPAVYYGDEAGLCGWTDPDNRRPFPWGREDPNLMALHRHAIALRRGSSALRRGSVMFLENRYGVLSFGRWDKHERLAVILNNNPTPQTLLLPVWKMGAAQGSMQTALATEGIQTHTTGLEYPIQNGIVTLTVPAFSGTVLRQKFG